MNLFKLFWEADDEHSYWLFTHPDRTKEQFRSDVEVLFRACGDEYLQSERGWVGAGSWTTFVADKLPEIGYVKVEPESVGFSGGYILSDDKDGQDWRDIIGTDLMKKAIAHNDKVRKRLNSLSNELNKV